MDSITPNKGYWQPVKARQPQVYPDGIRLHRQSGMVFVGSHLSGEDKVKRGEISEFSAGSRRRLRAALLELSIPGALRCGITLTVPWRGTNFEPLMDEWRQCLDRFAKSFRRRYPHSAYIFRVELQQRGAPHAHALAYIAREDIAPAPVPPASGGACADAMALACVGFEVRRIWSASVHDLHRGSIGAFERRGAKVEALATTGAMLRYVADHTSKRKQAQLGYKGKQWGIIGKGNLTKAEAESLPPPVSDYHWAVFLRMLRKAMRYRITAKHHHWNRLPPFGSVLRGSCRMVGDFYISAREVRRMYDFASRAERPDCSTWNKC